MGAENGDDYKDGLTTKWESKCRQDCRG